MKFFLPVLLFLSIDIAAQCKYETNDVDPFEKVERIRTKKIRVYWPTVTGPSVYMALSKVDTSYYVILSMYNIADPFCISAGHQLVILAEDESVFRFNNIDQLRCTEIGEPKFEGVFYFKSSESDLSVLGHSKMIQFRLQTNDGFVDWDIQKGNSAKNNGLSFFVDQVPCILH